MAQIDEVSSKLGGIEATQGHILKSLHTIESMFKDVSDKTVLHGAAIQSAHTRLDKIEPIIEEYETTRDKGKGMWYVICAGWTFVSGIAGAIASRMFM